MPVVIRRVSDVEGFVHWGDDLLESSEEDKWIPEAEAPEGCTVFKVRALNDAQLSRAAEGGPGVNSRVVKAGLVSVGGEPVKNIADWPVGWTTDVATLISQISQSPTGRRPSTSGVDQESGANV